MEDSGSQGDAGPTPTVPDGGLSLCSASQLLITTSNFTTAQTATLQLADQTTRVGSQDGEDENFDADSRPVRLACSGAILERTMGRLRVLSADDPFTTSQLIDLNRFNDESSM